METYKGEPQIERTQRLKGGGDYLELTYEDLEEKNMEIIKESEEALLGGKDRKRTEEIIRKRLANTKGVKAITLCFSDMEGRLHMLDYNLGYFMEASDNLTFDGSSIKGFSTQDKSDLRLVPDWTSMRFAPADVFGPGKVVMFANVHDQSGNFYAGDFRSNLKIILDGLREREGITVNVAPEIEGFLLEGVEAEQKFRESDGFKVVTESGYFHTLPMSVLRKFIDLLAEATKAMGFQNEKDHGEVASSSFELNYKYADALRAADQIQLYKLIARQIADNMGMTASFLPKPIQGINGSGMHTNISLSKDGKNIFFDENGEWHLSEDGHNFTNGVLTHAKDNCLVYNSSVNSYRRLDPKFEAPNQIKASSSDRSAMVRIPIGNEKSARIEVRTVAPDANPYFALAITIRAGLKAMLGNEEEKKEYAKVRGGETEILPSTIQGGIEEFDRSKFTKEELKPENHAKYLDLKRETASRSPEQLGTAIKNWEVWDNHEVTTQGLRRKF